MDDKKAIEFLRVEGEKLRQENQAMRACLAEIVKWHAKRDEHDAILPISEQSPEVARAMMLFN